MAPRFNPHTGEWEGLPFPGSTSSKSQSSSQRSTADRSGGASVHVDVRTVKSRPDGTVARIGHWFEGYWRDDITNNACLLSFLGFPIIFMLASFISSVAVGLLIVGLIIKATRTWVMGLAYLAFLPFAWLLRWVFYNAWTLVCALCFIFGILV